MLLHKANLGYIPIEYRCQFLNIDLYGILNSVNKADYPKATYGSKSSYQIVLK